MQHNFQICKKWIYYNLTGITMIKQFSWPNIRVAIFSNGVRNIQIDSQQEQLPDKAVPKDHELQFQQHQQNNQNCYFRVYSKY